LGAMSFATVRNVLSHSAYYETVSVIGLNLVAKSLELSPIPFEFMIPVPKLILVEIKKIIKLFIGSGDKAIFWPQIAKNVLNCLRKLFLLKVLN
jgi:hypothetical protein